MAHGIDAFAAGRLVTGTLVAEIHRRRRRHLPAHYLQNIAQTLASERVARDLRTASSPSSPRRTRLHPAVTTATLLTNLTSDVDAVKLFVSQAVGSIVSSVFLIVGASACCCRSTGSSASRSWRSCRSSASPSRSCSRGPEAVRKAQQADRRLNKVINESILGAALIRLLNSQHYEYDKFLAANTERATSASHPAPVREPDPDHRVLDEPGDADDPDARRPLRHPGR
jgi:ATP-binding cassette subfamily B protein